MIEWTKEVWDAYNEMTAVIATVGNPDRRASLTDCQSKLAKAITEYMDFLASPKEEVSEYHDEVEEAGDSTFDEETEDE
jgi:hypothetical protein